MPTLTERIWSGIMALLFAALFASGIVDLVSEVISTGPHFAQLTQLVILAFFGCISLGSAAHVLKPPWAARVLQSGILILLGSFFLGLIYYAVTGIDEAYVYWMTRWPGSLIVLAIAWVSIWIWLCIQAWRMETGPRWKALLLMLFSLPLAGPCMFGEVIHYAVPLLLLVIGGEAIGKKSDNGIMGAVIGGVAFTAGLAVAWRWKRRGSANHGEPEDQKP